MQSIDRQIRTLRAAFSIEPTARQRHWSKAKHGSIPRTNSSGTSVRMRGAGVRAGGTRSIVCRVEQTTNDFHFVFCRRRRKTKRVLASFFSFFAPLTQRPRSVSETHRPCFNYFNRRGMLSSSACRTNSFSAPSPSSTPEECQKLSRPPCRHGKQHATGIRILLCTAAA